MQIANTLPYLTNYFNTEDIKLGDDVIEQIKGFEYQKLTKEQNIIDSQK